MKIAKNTRPNRPIHIIREDEVTLTLCGFVASLANGWRITKTEISVSKRAWLCNTCRVAESARIARLEGRKSRAMIGEKQRDAEFTRWEEWNGEPHPLAVTR